MARHKEFDKEVVLEKAMLLFWQQGYDATSVRDLMDATGISSSSLYESFGDKRAVYLAALRRYCQSEQAGFQALITGHPNLKAALATTLQNAREHLTSSQGLFSMNSIIEFGNRDPEITALLWGHYEVIWAIFRDAIQAAQASGQIQNPQAAGDIANTLLMAIYGHASIMRVKSDFQGTEGILESLQRLLD